MILSDSNIVIEFAKGQDAKLRVLVPTLPVATCGVTWAEVLHGARNPTERRNLLAVLGAFGHLPIPEALWESVGDNLAAPRTRGVTVPFQDVVIATLGMDLGVEVWTRDRQFARIQSVLPALRLFQEPP